MVWPLLLGADTRITQPLTIVISKTECSQSVAANAFSQRVFNGLVPKALLNLAARFEFLWDDAHSEHPQDKLTQLCEFAGNSPCRS